MYTIQQASLLIEIPASSIRYYEKIDLIPPIKRNEQEHRIFDEQDIELLKLIKCFRNLGMSIEDIRKKSPEGRTIISKNRSSHHGP